MLRDYQILAFNKLIEHNKSFIFWPRDKGKTYLLYSFIDYFVKNNKDQNIMFFVNDGRTTSTVIKNLQLFLNNHGSIENDCKIINDNIITIISILSNRYGEALRGKNINCIIFDDFNIDLSYLNELSSYINVYNSNCKIIMTSSFINTMAIKMLDYNNDFYINIKCVSDDERKKYIYHKFMNYDYDSLIKNDLAYKSDNLLDFDYTIYQRRKKIQALNKKSNEI